MSATPRTTVDPEGDKNRALQHYARAARRRRDAETAERNAARFARDAGASWRELAAASGDRDHMTVKRMVQRTDDQSEDDDR